MATQVIAQQTISASPEELFQAWLDPSSPRGPWVGDGSRHLDPKEGGLFYWSDRNFSDSEHGLEWAHFGRFVEIVEPSLIRYTWMSQFTHGLESVIEVRFVKADGGTEVSLLQTGLPDGKDGTDHQNAWIRILGQMSSHFLAPAPASRR